MLQGDALDSLSLEETIRSLDTFKRKLIEVHTLDEVMKLAEVEDVILVTFNLASEEGDEHNSRITSNFLENVCVKENGHIQFVKMVTDCCPGQTFAYSEIGVRELTNYNNCDELLEEANIVKPGTYPFVEIQMNHFDVEMLEKIDV